MKLLLRVRNFGIAAETPSLTAGQLEVYPLQKAGNEHSRGNSLEHPGERKLQSAMNFHVRWVPWLQRGQQ
jgi:hypothetical protein